LAKSKEYEKLYGEERKKRKADKMKSMHRSALKCWKVFRCVCANRGVKAPFRSILPSGAVFDYIRERGLKGFGVGWHGGLEYQGFSQNLAHFVLWA